ncbi:1,4-alpha-glucan branching enzyme, partial [Streptomyces albogriseolus]|uniref:GlgB N-terminal domain-containing protein n=1 Tax=Streptomyces albogriseolus TaxID=1887 RepID=UPI003469B1B6
MTPRPESSGPSPEQPADRRHTEPPAPERKKPAAAAKKSAARKTPAKKTAAAAKTAATAKATVQKAAAKKTAVTKAAGKTPATDKKAGRTPAARRTPGDTTTPAGSAAVPEEAVPPAPPEAEIAVSPAVDAGDRERLLHGTHHAPHSVLGAHPVPGGVAFRAFRPYARAVTVESGGVTVALHDDGDGFFSGLLPLREVPAYRLRVAYEGTELETEDAYRFLPTLGELDLHLLGEGRHEQLWTVLGAHPMTHQGVSGTRFSVWAPNALGVQVAGSFNFWDGTGFPMRSLGSSGVWELFVPGIGEGELYKFEITRPDGSKTLRADPMARRTEVPPATSSIVTSSRYEWGDAEWLERRAEVPAHRAPFSAQQPGGGEHGGAADHAGGQRGGQQEPGGPRPA